MISSDSYTRASCLPWLPVEYAAEIAMRVDRIGDALDAYAGAPPIARTRHADILTALVRRAQPNNLTRLTRLAIATGMEAAWTESVEELHYAPDKAIDVVVTAPWDDIHAAVQTTMLSLARRSSVCAAIAYARGVRDQPPPITRETACAFFAAVTRESWNALMEEEKRTWISCLVRADPHLAVRSLGPDPAFLAHAELHAALVAAVRRHVADEGVVRWMLLPVAMSELSIAAVPSVVVALAEAPPDPVAFVQIAGDTQVTSRALHAWIAANPSLQATAAATTALLIAARLRDATVASRPPIDNVAARCAALAAAFAGWSSEDATALLAALPDDVRTALHPGANALADALAHPDRRNTFRQALNALAALPPAAALPAFHALTVLVQTTNPLVQQEAGEGLAQALRDHGRIFAVIVGMLRDDVRAAIVPPPDAPSVESAINDLAAADPLVAHYLSHALHANDSIAAYNALTAASLEETRRIWQSLPETLQHVVLGDLDALAANAAAEGQEATLRQTLQRWGTDDLPPLLALCMLIDDDEARRTRGAALLAQRPDVAAALLPLLRNNVRAALESVPAIAFASADLPFAQTNAVVRVRRRRCSP
jgi:hypothetical protein